MFFCVRIVLDVHKDLLQSLHNPSGISGPSLGTSELDWVKHPNAH